MTALCCPAPAPHHTALRGDQGKDFMPCRIFYDRLSSPNQNLMSALW